MKTRIFSAVAAAALLSTLTLTSGCHTADPEGQRHFPTDVQENTPNKGEMVLDVYAVDAGAVTNGNDAVCVWSCPIFADGGETTHRFDSCEFNEQMSVVENTHTVTDEDPTKAEARAQAAVASCNTTVMPPGLHDFGIRNMPNSWHLFNMNTVVTERQVRIFDGGANNWRYMCIAQDVDSCHSNSSTGTTGTNSDGGSDSDGETSTTGGSDVCVNHSDCLQDEWCNGGSCDPKIQAVHRPAGLSPDPDDDTDVVGNGDHWIGPDENYLDFKYLAGELKAGKAVEFSDDVMETVTVDIADGPMWPNDDPLCFNMGNGEVDCPDTESIPDGEILFGYMVVNSPAFITPVSLEARASNVPVH